MRIPELDEKFLLNVKDSFLEGRKFNRLCTKRSILTAHFIITPLLVDKLICFFKVLRNLRTQKPSSSIFLLVFVFTQ